MFECLRHLKKIDFSDDKEEMEKMYEVSIAIRVREDKNSRTKTRCCELWIFVCEKRYARKREVISEFQCPGFWITFDATLVKRDGRNE